VIPCARAAWPALLLAVIAAPVHAATPSEAPTFTMLAASQVGYGPTMRKEFTSPREFRSFRVVRPSDGHVAFTGGKPARVVHTTLLGPVDTAWIGDFSGLTAPGRYVVVADNGMSSYPFDVGPAVFDPAARAVLRWFYYQRAFTAVEARFAEGPWFHPSDADKAPGGVRKGWHDAGDLSVYNASMSAALFWLLETWSDFAPADDDVGLPESGNGVPDLLDEARWGLEWLLSVQAPEGGFRNTTCEERYGPYGTNTPNNVPRYKAGEVGTIATARAVGTLAYAAAVFRPIDLRFADTCLAAARRGYEWLRARPGEHSDGPTCPAMRRDGDPVVGRQVRMYAAAGMLLATGETSFRDDFEASYEEVRHIPDFNNVNGFAVALYLRAPAGDPGRKAAIRRQLDVLAAMSRDDGGKHPFQWASFYYWGSISNGFHRTGIFNARACLDTPPRAADCDQALANVHYVLGRNSLNHCYVSGLPGVTRGKSAAFHHWLKALAATPAVFPGMVAGGPIEAPDANDRSYPHSRPYSTWGYWGDQKNPRSGTTPIDARYTDNDSWSTNEVQVQWQATTLYSLHLARRLARGSPAR
jgi:endoglucanase